MRKKIVLKFIVLIIASVCWVCVSFLSFAETDVISQLNSLTNSLWISHVSGTSTYSYKNSDWTTPLWWQTLNNLRKEWYTDAEIMKVMEEAWLDGSAYFGLEYENDNVVQNNQNYVYKSRSCKTYDIEYVNLLKAYTSPNLISKEYFVNQDYFKRYIDSKNKQIPWCPTNMWRISTSYLDKSDSDDQFIAPNGKIYFIQRNDNWYFESNELKTTKSFVSLSELKHYIRDRNPLIWM